MNAAPSDSQLGRAVARAAESLQAARSAVSPGARLTFLNRQPTYLQERVEAVARADLVEGLRRPAEGVVDG